MESTVNVEGVLGEARAVVMSLSRSETYFGLFVKNTCYWDCSGSCCWICGC